MSPRSRLGAHTRSMTDGTLFDGTLTEKTA